MTKIQLVLTDSVQIEATLKDGTWTSSEDYITEYLNAETKLILAEPGYIPEKEEAIVRPILEAFPGSIMLEEDRPNPDDLFEEVDFVTP